MTEAHVGVNVELERLLARAGWTPEDLGDRLNRLAASMRLRDHIHRKSVRRWVRAMPSCPIIGRPSEPWPALVCHLLGQQTGETVTPAGLGWGEVALCGGGRSRPGPTVDLYRSARRLGSALSGCWCPGVTGRPGSGCGFGVASYQAAAGSPTTSFQVANRVFISCRYPSAVSRWRWGRKCGDIPLNADRNRWAPPGERNFFIACSRCLVG
jgi:hypothetical protein